MSKRSRTSRTRERARTVAARPSAPPPAAETVVPAVEASALETPAAVVHERALPALDVAPAVRLAIVVALAAATIVAYLPVLNDGFLNWDDPAYVTGNPGIRTLGWQTVVWAFTTFQEGIWHPLTWLSLAVDHALYGGLVPRGFHLTNLLLHTANTVLVYLVWERMTGATWRSAVVAALFGLHPMHVESVAWVTERKDVLSTFFWLLTIAAYARYVRLRTTAALGLVTVAFLCGLLSKPMLVTLPFVLLLLDYWPFGRLSWDAVNEKAPLLVLVAIVAGISMSAVSGVSKAAIPDPIPVVGLVSNAVVSCVRYLELTLWPAHLSPWYSHPWFEGAPLTAVDVAGATLFLLAVSAGAVLVGRRFPYAPVGWFWFLGALVPMLGLVYNGRQGMADRYAYVPHIGLFVALTWAIADLPALRAAGARAVAGVALAGVLVALGVRTSRQTRVWHDDASFWGYTVTVNHDSFIAHQALAMLVQDQGRLREAIPLYRRATRIRPELARLQARYARLLADTGHPGPAAAAWRRALAVEPNSPDYRFGLGQALLAGDRPTSARRQLERALALRPNFRQARDALAVAEARATP